MPGFCMLNHNYVTNYVILSFCRKLVTSSQFVTECKQALTKLLHFVAKFLPIFSLHYFNIVKLIYTGNFPQPVYIASYFIIW